MEAHRSGDRTGGHGQPEATGRTSRRTSRRLRATGGGGGRSRQSPRTHTPRALSFVLSLAGVDVECSVDGAVLPTRAMQWRRCSRDRDVSRRRRKASAGLRSPRGRTTVWSGPSTRGTGVTVEHSATASGQRNRNRHPGVGSTTFGGSPRSVSAVTPSGARGSGTADSSSWVYGCRGPRQHLLGRPGLDDLAGVHDDEPVGDVPRAGDVVGDVQERHALVVAQVGHQVEQPDPDRHVEHRHRLVGEDQLRPVGERLREPDPLALATAQLVRVAVEDVAGRRQPDRLEDPLRLVAALSTRHSSGRCSLSPRMIAVRHPERRVQRAERVLEHHRHVAAVGQRLACGRACWSAAGPRTGCGRWSARTPWPAAGRWCSCR